MSISNPALLVNSFGMTFPIGAHDTLSNGGVGIGTPTNTTKIGVSFKNDAGTNLNLHGLTPEQRVSFTWEPRDAARFVKFENDKAVFTRTSGNATTEVIVKLVLFDGTNTFRCRHASYSAGCNW